MTEQTSPQTPDKKVILIVEDDTSVQALYQKLLTQQGYVVILTDTVDKAHQALGENRVNLILLDIMLADRKNGFDFLELAKKQNLLKTTSVVVLSNLDEDENALKHMGVSKWLVKSNVSAQSVVSVINDILT